MILQPAHFHSGAQSSGIQSSSKESRVRCQVVNGGAKSLCAGLNGRGRKEKGKQRENERRRMKKGVKGKEEEKEDESDTSNSVDEIVKSEIKSYDSFLGIMDSNIDHFSPVDNSEYRILILDRATR
uniref:Uncharacterized protein n=1 Tax=Timema tahoe TaxID=61484 RepID=A0A7R9P102_9NEOP|nr:unnamed protein product [Timema tahoe]